MFPLEQTDLRGLLQAAERKSELAVEISRESEESVYLKDNLYPPLSSQGGGAGRELVEERQSSLFITVQSRGGRKLRKYMCRTIFHHPCKNREDETQRVV